MRVKHIAISTALMLATTAAVAQEQKGETSLIDALASCLAIRDDNQRLACTDIAGRRLVDASKGGQIVVLDKEEVKATRRSLFGFALPRIGLFGKNGLDRPEDEVAELETKITRVTATGQGKYTITMEGDARWATVEPWTRDPLPAVGLTVTIKKAALGSYFLKIGRSRAVRATRVG